jgi:hypothetical protein
MVSSTFPLLSKLRVKYNELGSVTEMELAPLRTIKFKVSWSENVLFRSKLMKYRRPLRSLNLELIKVINKINKITFDIYIIIKFLNNEYIL